MTDQAEPASVQVGRRPRTHQEKRDTRREQLVNLAHDNVEVEQWPLEHDPIRHGAAVTAVAGGPLRTVAPRSTETAGLGNRPRGMHQHGRADHRVGRIDVGFPTCREVLVVVGQQ
jgi:hypothetical protein